MEIAYWCIMPSHIQLIFWEKNNKLSDIIRDFKRHASKIIQKTITENIQESRKEPDVVDDGVSSKEK